MAPFDTSCLFSFGSGKHAQVWLHWSLVSHQHGSIWHILPIFNLALGNMFKSDCIEVWFLINMVLSCDILPFFQFGIGKHASSLTELLNWSLPSHQHGKQVQVWLNGSLASHQHGKQVQVWLNGSLASHQHGKQVQVPLNGSLASHQHGTLFRGHYNNWIQLKNSLVSNSTTTWQWRLRRIFKHFTVKLLIMQDLEI